MEIKKIIVGEIRTNCYIISQNDECFIVDPGDEINKITKNIDGYQLRFILLTHGHFDHVLAAEHLHEQFPEVPIYVCCEDADLLKSLAYQNRYSSRELKDLKLNLRKIKRDCELTFCGEKIKVIKTPGHSHGSVCYLIDGHLFSGDTLFYHTIGRTDFWTSNHEDMISSLKKLSKLPHNTKVYPGHGRLTTIAEELRYGYLPNEAQDTQV